MASSVSTTSFGYHVYTPSHGTLTTSKLWIKSIIFTSSIAQNGSYVVFQDNNGCTIGSCYADISGSSEDIYCDRTPIDGLKISSINGAATAGTIAIYIK